jgi:leucyl aminopeptidase (aminopeptidase T)
MGHVSDLGGRSTMSEAQFALCKRAAGLECELEQMEGRMSQGEEINLDSYGRAASHLRRILETLGLERKARDVTPDGVELEVFSPMRARWAADAAAEGG